MKKPALRICVLLLLHFSFITLHAQAGKDGVENVLTANVVFNRYDVVTTSIPAGANTVTVANIANLGGGAAGTNNPYAFNALSYGDLIMVIKMQGAAINTANSSAYGSVNAMNGVGNYELALVKGVTGNTITTCLPFNTSFTVNARERVQVVRIPRLSTLIIVPGASIVAAPWSAGYRGGVVALEIDGNVAVHGAVSADGAGYRGGMLDNNTANAPCAITDYLSTNDANGAEKGEGIAGFQTDYDQMGGRYGRGAAANGGGGANAGIPASWNGDGNPDISDLNWLNAWNLELANFSASTSSGGGRGGYSYSSVNLDARAISPDNAAWGGDYRRNVGGKGGRPLSYNSNLLFMGGGGGAGDANNNSGGAGGNGGGIVYLLITGSLSGAGTISANGKNGFSSGNTNNDGAGGAGAGGAIRVNVQGAVSQVSIQANGGKGGSQLIAGAESEGPGGGGGGGYISVVGNPFITIQADAGTNGLTSSASLTEFTANGATSGGAGLVVSEAFANIPASTCFALPLHFLSFTAEKILEAIQLKWTTADEVNVDHYEVQTSTNGMAWLSVKEVAAYNRAFNQYTEILPAGAPLLYLRIRSVDADGRSQLSEQRLVRSVANKLALDVQGHNLIIKNLPLHGRAIRIYASGGQLVRSVSADGAMVMVDIGGLSPGVYYLEAGERLKFIKQ